MGIQIKKFIKLKKDMLETEDIEIFKMLYPAYANESDKVIKREIKLMKERQAAVNTREKEMTLQDGINHGQRQQGGRKMKFINLIIILFSMYLIAFNPKMERLEERIDTLEKQLLIYEVTQLEAKDYGARG